MTPISRILSHCTIRDNCATVNGHLRFRETSDLAFAEFIARLYQESGLKYPKFHKMDPLCRLGLMSAELLLEGAATGQYPEDRIGVILSNSASSLETDERFNRTISDPDNYFPSPALFVYTLPNLMIGEICIRHKFKGENTCFISESFNAAFISDYVNDLLVSGSADLVICGWVELDRSHRYDAVLYLVERIPAGEAAAPASIFNAENAARLYRALP